MIGVSHAVTHNAHAWALVLAAGEGTRLSAITRDPTGTPVPKQYCSLDGGPTLLLETLRRGQAFAGRDRLAVVVGAQHERWWRDALWAVPASNVVVQPENRGTAIGILLSVLSIAARDPDARIVFLPADHHVRDEYRLAVSLRRAASSPLAAGELILLGMQPEEPDPELGYIVPASGVASGGESRVARFVEKPSQAVAAELVAGGALWNSFIIAADAAGVIGLMRERHPWLVDTLETARMRGPAALDELYRHLPAIDFSRDVLQGAESRLRLLSVPPCGWSDLGTPRRVSSCLERVPPVRRPRAASFNAVNLAAACARLFPTPQGAIT
jgi:mannose-1-phosphate guanylyltransferase